MNRKILFRGKDVYTDEWAYGDLHTLCDRPHIHTEETSFPYAGKRSFIKEETIGQFTGLYDVCNNPIYEGDIIKSNSIKHLIGYSVEDARFYCIPTRYVGDVDFERSERAGLDQKWINEFGKVVIGNKWDNPDLLKG